MSTIAEYQDAAKQYANACRLYSSKNGAYELALSQLQAAEALREQKKLALIAIAEALPSDVP